MNVRETTRKTLVILLLAGLLFLFEQFLHRRADPYYASFVYTINAAFRGNGYLEHLLRIALLLLFLAGAADVVLRGKDQLRLFRSFRYLPVFAGILLFFFASHTETLMSTFWFQQLCSVVVAIALRLRFSGLARIPGSGSKWILPFLVQGAPKKDTQTNVRADLCILYYLRLAILIVFVLLLISFALYCSDHRDLIAAVWAREFH